ncbi:P-II family nitrogen regulator [Magnetovibrio sp. PR-2]|uniref:P-II family nitrogen regulator n=1 Tax=Magnetovibrio sp. PR-2 TaxID=3120356 RepID=UPI002FCDE9EC
MNLKMIMALVKDEITQTVIDAAREKGATGATIITSAQGEGLKKEKTFLGLDLAAQRDIVLFMVAAPKAREILEEIARAGKFDEDPGSGIACQIALEDAVGITSQLQTLKDEVEEEL